MRRHFKSSYRTTATSPRSAPATAASRSRSRGAPQALDAPLTYPWGGSGTVADFALILAEHDEEHAVEIEAEKTKTSGVN